MLLGLIVIDRSSDQKKYHISSTGVFAIFICLPLTANSEMHWNDLFQILYIFILLLRTHK